MFQRDVRTVQWVGEYEDKMEQFHSLKTDLQFEFVDSIPDELNCCICLSVLRDPNLTSCCGNHFCQSCISRIKNEENPCPLCQEPNFTVMLDKYFLRKVNGLRLRCSNSDLGCEWVGELGNLRNHLDAVCDFVVVTCDYGCGDKIPRHSLADHKTSICLLRPFTCKYCGYSATWSLVVGSHLSVCENYPMLCPNKCAIGKIERKNIDKHLNEECLLQVVACDFEFAGCYVQLHRQDMPQHLNESVSSHLALMPKVCQHFLQELQEKDQLIGNLTTAIRLQQTAIESLETELRQDTKEQALKYPPVELVMPNFQTHKYLDDQWFSEPFYTHLGGYKLCLSVYGNGFGKGKGSHVSVFANMMRGDNDHKLKWPFRGHVVVQCQISQKDNQPGC